MLKKTVSHVNLRLLFLPKNNHWLKRIALVFSFILFDYFSTLIFCHVPDEEANILARTFMENAGIPLGLTMFVLSVNLPIYVILSLDSNMIRLPNRIATPVEVGVDLVFAWFIAGLHFSGGTSWFWYAPEFVRQVSGAIIYLSLAIIIVKYCRKCEL
jgi:hypothetical protein